MFKKLAAVSLIISLATVGVALSSSNIIGKLKTNSVPQEQQLTSINGADTPDAIPDHVGYEFLLRSLVSNKEKYGEKEDIRVRATVLEVTEDESEIKIILALAHRFEQEISMLDQQAKQLKDMHWPEPTQAVIDQLADLQHKKESLVQKTVDSLTKKLDDNDIKKTLKGEDKGQKGAEKVSKHIYDKVKRRVVSATPPHPTGHANHGGLARMFGTILGFGFIKPPSPAPAQYMGQGYSYSNTTVYYASGDILGYGATAENYSSNGHTYELTTTLYLEDGRSVTTTTPGFFSPYLRTQTLTLPIVDVSTLLPYDRFARTQTRGRLRCPRAGGSIFAMASAFAWVDLDASVALGVVRWISPTSSTIRKGETAVLSTSVIGSPGLPSGVTVNLAASVVEQQRAVNVTVSRTLPVISPITVISNQGVNARFSYVASQSQPALTTTSTTFKGEVNLTIVTPPADSTIRVVDSPGRSDQVITLQLP